jgi:lipopolysaccharide/colanic/teichoic acid biosynthesis glycosyltransferase
MHADTFAQRKINVSFVNYFSKYIREYFLQLLLIVPVSLLCVLISIVLVCSGQKKVFFSQLRTGKGGTQFKLYKFRTLKETNTVTTLEKSEQPCSMAPINNFLRKTGLDELPQFFNILKGDMHIVGPRPFVDKDLDHLTPQQFYLRHKVKPGITGLWQINRKYDQNDKSYINFDLDYIQHLSFLLDLEILMNTAGYMLKMRGR